MSEPSPSTEEPGADSFWQTFGTMTGPPSTYIYYTWRENQTPV